MLEYFTRMGIVYMAETGSPDPTNWSYRVSNELSNLAEDHRMLRVVLPDLLTLLAQILSHTYHLGVYVGVLRRHLLEFPLRLVELVLPSSPAPRGCFRVRKGRILKYLPPFYLPLLPLTLTETVPHPFFVGNPTVFLPTVTKSVGTVTTDF